MTETKEVEIMLGVALYSPGHVIHTKKERKKERTKEKLIFTYNASNCTWWV